MNENLKKLIEEELVKLPQEAQLAIVSVDWSKIAEEIGNKYLLEEEIESFKKEIVLVLLGLEYPAFLSRNIKNSIGVSEIDVEKMTTEVIEKIFTPIAGELKSQIKNKISTKDPSWEKTINFIISGGDYSIFLRK